MGNILLEISDQPVVFRYCSIISSGTYTLGEWIVFAIKDGILF